MKIYLTTILFLLSLVACNNNGQPKNETQTDSQDSASFFPVTNYLKGQIAEIKTSGVNPLQIDSLDGKTDSIWLKVEKLDSAFTDFLYPEIDSANLTGFFSETKFADQTLDTYTFTYTPLPGIPDSISLLRWDVYINRETNMVKRIFLVKKTADNKELQLTWQSGNWCKMVIIATDKEGRQFVQKERLIKWRFD